VTLNCGALPSELIEAELFGAEAGAYTGAGKAREGRFEAADGGSLLLDEIGNLSSSGQMKLLRVLETGRFERLGSNKTREVKVRVPAGVADGQRIRLPGKGTPGRNGGPSGDLFIICRVAAHRLFGRDGENLTVRVPITFAEAALGADIQVPTLSGERVTVRVKPGTQSGTRHRVKGRGIETAKHHGDLIVTVDALQMAGIPLMTAPNDVYYEMLEERLPGHGEPVAALQARGILLDGNTAGGDKRLLLQIFSQTLLGPVFFEFIQRKKDEGFGEGNFKALFESMERDQLRRGVLGA
jgi:hypothetical protein